MRVKVRVRTTLTLIAILIMISKMAAIATLGTDADSEVADDSSDQIEENQKEE